MRRIVSLWLPHWPIERHLLRNRPILQGGSNSSASGAAHDPLALVRREAKGIRLFALNEAAAASGLKPGMTLADARAILPDLATAKADVEADAADLNRLALWAMRFTPLVAINRSTGGEADALWLDVTGCTHLFGGEAALLDELAARLAALGHRAQAAIAPTPGAAFALAHGLAPHTPSRLRLCSNPDDIRSAIAALPVSLLRLGEDAVSDLNRFGLKRIGALYDLPRAALHARFDARNALGRARADMVLRRLDEALGSIDEPVSPLMPEPVLRLPHAFIEPVFDTAVIARALNLLLERLAPMLERMGLGARHLRLAVYRADGNALHLNAAASAPSRDAAHWARLFAETLETIDAPFGVDMVALNVIAADLLKPAQQSLDAQHERGVRQSSLNQLVDRIANRFGPQHMLRSAEHESHLPERRECHISMLRSKPAQTERAPPATASRPFRLFDRPEPIEVMAEVPDGPPMRFRWRRRLHAVMRAEGPERIAAEWWRDDARLRDYYRVENTDGARFWLYREGRYEEPEGPPRWFMHGLFV